MHTAILDPWVQRLKESTLDLTDLGTLQHLRLAEMIDQLTAAFQVVFLDRTRRDKRELGLAHDCHRRTFASGKTGSRVSARKRTSATETYQHCVFLTTEADHLTTLAVINLLRVRVPRGEGEPVDLFCEAGFSLYHDVDGWKIKLLKERTISLDRKSLRERGWRVQLGENGSSQ